jgi:glutamine synthetase
MCKRPAANRLLATRAAVLKDVLAEAREMGFTFNVGPECEFFPVPQ